MKVLRIHERFKNWRNMIIFMSCTLLMACSKPMDIYKPIDVSKSGQSVKFDFEISKVREYRVSLLFAIGDSQEEKERRSELFRAHVDGVAIPITFRLVKDGKVLFDEEINTVGATLMHTVHYKEKNIDTAVRTIDIFQFTPGHYSMVITTLEDVPAFNGIESFVHITDSVFNGQIYNLL
ncbi:DUF5625 family protein [Photorhabdus aegyptia]|uniref:DUF5625 domain-containing protein n=1 Tax=Photorhabdus aegyptia TaxID=2805098 RepID=A0A022PHQ8_9GAMM|nr:DUF5625 family protein [Photorhabdus aegyptia]EYU14045.1 hypothetical protein BA1DRAFT_03445 [Photorhabdus aegyptia]